MTRALFILLFFFHLDRDIIFWNNKFIYSHRVACSFLSSRLFFSMIALCVGWKTWNLYSTFLHADSRIIHSLSNAATDTSTSFSSDVFRPRSRDDFTTAQKESFRSRYTPKTVFLLFPLIARKTPRNNGSSKKNSHFQVHSPNGSSIIDVVRNLKKYVINCFWVS